MSSVSRSVGRPVSRSVLAGQLNNLASIIKSIFATGEQGFAYDPNDLSTMWQDAAGTVPVTGAGQPVGLMKDKSGRNNHAFQTVSASRPILQRNATAGAYYLAFDGADDFLQTSNIDFTTTDKVSIFTGVRKLSDAATGMLMELSASADTNLNSFYLAAPLATSPFRFYTKAASFTTAVAVPTGVAQAPISCVVTVKSAMVNGSDVTLKVNQQSYVTKNTTAIGNYGNYPLYIGRRGGATSPFNGHLYSLIGIGRLTTDSETIALEKVIAKNTGVTLNV